MRILTAPRIHMMSSQVFHPNPDPEFAIPEDGSGATQIGSYAAKVAYHSFGEAGRSNVGNQHNIVESHHGRVLEHVVFGLHIIGISRGLGNEIITHKHITITQESTRYVDLVKHGAFVLEPWMTRVYEQFTEHVMFAAAGRANASWGSQLSGYDLLRIGVVAEHIRIAGESFASYDRQYRELFQIAEMELKGRDPTVTDCRKWARGKARNSLPLGTATGMVCTGNMRAWRNFIEMRTEYHAEEEMRRLAPMVTETLITKVPDHLYDYVVEEVRGWPMWTTANVKI